MPLYISDRTSSSPLTNQCTGCYLKEGQKEKNGLDGEEGGEISYFLLVFKTWSNEKKCFCEWQSAPDTAALWGREKVTFTCGVTLIIPDGWSILFTEHCVFKDSTLGTLYGNLCYRPQEILRHFWNSVQLSQQQKSNSINCSLD